MYRLNQEEKLYRVPSLGIGLEHKRKILSEELSTLPRLRGKGEENITQPQKMKGNFISPTSDDPKRG